MFFQPCLLDAVTMIVLHNSCLDTAAAPLETTIATTHLRQIVGPPKWICRPQNNQQGTVSSKAHSPFL